MCFKFILFIFIVYVVSDSSCYIDKSWKDYTYIDATQSFYKLHLNNISWSEANTTCTEDDAFLFYPESTYELMEVKKWLENCTAGAHCKKNIFIYVGYGDEENRNVYKTVDGVSVNDVYNNWRPGEPNNYDATRKVAEDCVELNTQDLQLNDIICNETYDNYGYVIHPFICKKKLAALYNVQNHETWKDYTYIAYPQSFYKMHIKKVSWLEANRTCISDGGTLFYPESRHEVNLVKEWWEKCQSGPNCLNNDYVHMGYSDIKLQGHFVTVDGIEVEQVFHNWQPGEPNLLSGEDCVELSGRNLNINDIPCEGDSDRVKHSFICKKKLSGAIWDPESSQIIMRFDSGLFHNFKESANHPEDITDTLPINNNKASSISYSYIILVLSLIVFY